MEPFLGAAIVVAGLVVQQPSSDLCDAPEAARSISVRVRPWADVFVDGKLAAAGTPRAKLALSTGTHVLSFRNSAAFDVDRLVQVAPCGPLPDLVVEMVRRPALLSVRSNVPDAKATVCGPEVPILETEDEPLHVVLPRGRSEVEVRVFRRGYSTVTRKVLLKGGERTKITVFLAEE